MTARAENTVYGVGGLAAALLAPGYAIVPLDPMSGERIPDLIPDDWRPHLTEWILEAVEHG